MHPYLRRVLLAAIAIAALITTWNYLSPGRRLHAAQRAFLGAVEAKEVQAAQALLSREYHDERDWKFEDWPALLGDLRVVAPGLHLSGEFAEIESGTLEGKVNVELRIPGGEQWLRRFRAIQAPTRFVWKRESWLPWSWRLHEIRNPELDVTDYRPGQFSDY